MLRQLTVNNVALVAHLDLPLQPGLTVLTGESGAGKSVLLGALGLVLGSRAQAKSIRPGASQADVTAEFDISGKAKTEALLATNELTDPDQPERLLLRRVISAEGRSRAFVNGTPVNLAVLRELARSLLDIHGQDEPYRLAQPAVQRSLLDDYACKATDLARARKAYRAWQAAASSAAEIEAALQQDNDRAQLLRYQLQELAELNLSADEFATADAEFRRLAQGRDIEQRVTAALDALSADTSAEVARELRSINDDQENLDAARELVASARELLGDAEAELRRYADSLQVDAEQVQALEDRLGAIHDMARKHRVAPEQLHAHIESLQMELSQADGDAGDLARLREEAAQQRAAFDKAANALRRQRRKGAPQFAKAVSEIMATLGIKGGELFVDLEPAESEHGIDAVSLRIVTNPKYPAAPLTEIASGGEQARISLAISLVAAEKTALPCLVLDEADVGVGGTTADVIGRLLRRLSAHTQVLCVTHAPQVAALGDHHARVLKDDEQNTQIEILSPAARVEELARMLAGSDITRQSRDYARTLLAEATD